MDGHDLQPGLILADRYRIEDLVGEVAGARTWRAMDTILNRSVGIQVLSSDDPRTAAFLEAARRSTAVPDPRFLRVLDAVAEEAGATYVVREWTRAVPLAVLLREGPLTNRRAASLVSEVADAMARAHEVGVYHRRIDPATILVKDNDAVRITGLGTDHALHTSGPVAGQAPRDGGAGALGAPASTAQALDAEQVDVTGLGRLLYACLVARWPGGRDFGLAPAPTEHGRLLRPRQVRAGVSRDVDTVCDRILGDPPRHHAPPLRSARDIASALMLVGEDESTLTDTAPSLGGQVPVAAKQPVGEASAGSRQPVNWPAGATAVTGGQQAPEPSSGRRPVVVARALVAMGVALLVAMAAVLAFFIGRNSADPGQAEPSGDPSSPAAVASRPLPARGVSDFDPQGDLTENPEAAPYAVDGQPGTTWTTSQYAGDPKLGGLKSGVGLLVDLGSQKQVVGVEVSFGAAPTRYQVWATPAGTTDAPTQLTELRQLAERNARGETSRVRFPTSAVTTQFVLVWLTSLPEEADGLYRGVIRDISVEGTA